MRITIFVIACAVAAPMLVAMVVIGYRGRTKRIAALTAFATQHGLAFAKRDDQWSNLVHWGRPWGVGTRRHAIDVLSGPYRGRPATVFTYRYTTSSPGSSPDGGNSSDNNFYAVYTLGLPHRVPALRVARQLAYGRLVHGVGVDPIIVDSPDFRASFDVRSEVPQFALDVLTPGLQQWLLGNAAPGFTMVDDRIFVAFPGRLVAANIVKWLDYLSTIVDQIPGRGFS